ncbi:hypothetical protein B4102_2996 [Heyndrickxia sporothermodurans]|uniref:Endonuclease/exonuclease/phosphatase domain-containing protein n=1 Tax=Heyndrickxia sporothermodurans TaxID=46224 RepID=A0A150L3Y2_9BACI|nr:endonuclease/exonuclease/phosphatase family protein [Heyndrickxia sporothermodurans]KYD07020.1 hypothetical protein B4102_2996 [Heyndrickxia sporothermodurans]
MSADILVIPECESPEKWRKSNKIHPINQFLWFGDNPNKGIGVITLNNNYQIEVHPSYNKDFRYIIPLIVSGGDDDFILFAIWAQNAKKKYYSYIGQIHLALDYYKFLLNDPCIIVGDWNSNKIFDHINRDGTHSDVVEFLKSVNIKSAYHTYFNEEHGEETKPTHYFRKSKDRPFHIDYVFVSETILKKLNFIEVGSFEEWIKLSDHTPIYREINN